MYKKYTKVQHLLPSKLVQINDKTHLVQIHTVYQRTQLIKIFIESPHAEPLLVFQHGHRLPQVRRAQMLELVGGDVDDVIVSRLRLLPGPLPGEVGFRKMVPVRLQVQLQKISAHVVTPAEFFLLPQETVVFQRLRVFQLNDEVEVFLRTVYLRHLLVHVFAKVNVIVHVPHRGQLALVDALELVQTSGVGALLGFDALLRQLLRVHLLVSGLDHFVQVCLAVKTRFRFIA